MPDCVASLSICLFYLCPNILHTYEYNACQLGRIGLQRKSVQLCDALSENHIVDLLRMNTHFSGI